MVKPMQVLKPMQAESIATANPAHLRGKRVAMVLFSFYPEDPRPRRAAEALVNCGMKVDLICLREHSTEAGSEVYNGVNIRRLPLTRRRGGVLGYLYQYTAFLFLSSAFITFRSLAERYDLVYVHNMPDFLVFSGLIPRLFGAKVVLDLHDPMPELMRTIFEIPEESVGVRVLKRVEKGSIGFADAVVTVNRACAKLFAARSCAPEKVTVVMNSPDERIFRVRVPGTGARKTTSQKPYVIMYHGSLVERNGLDLAVEALARVRSSIPEVQLRIYGSSNSFLERVMASVRDRGLEDAVRYLGPKMSEQIAEAIEECDLGIIPNQRNIFTELNTPTRIFEYLALGKPVITPRAPGICDYFDDESLIYFELGDAEGLARKIDWAFHHPEEVIAVTKRGQEVHRAHTWTEERLALTTLVAELLPADETSVASLTTAERNPRHL
jgi:glycosyltransferase involved in cell wall biosynthesis